MLSEGDVAPDFELQGTDGTEIGTYRLSDYTDDGYVLLSFYPFDFAPSCTEEVCGLRDAEWFQFVDHLDILGISTDGPYAHMQFIEQYELDFPLLSDTNATVAREYGTFHERWRGMKDVIRRATFLVDENRIIKHVSSTEDPLSDPSLDPVLQAVEALGNPASARE